MTDRNEHSLVESPEAAAQPAVDVSRRAMLRRAAPAIVTLYSGAALAQSSNLITVDSTPGAEASKYRCLNTQGIPQVGGNKYDLGQPALGHVTRIQSQKQYYKKSSSGGPSSQTATPPQMCSTGGEYYRKDWNSYTKVNVKKGVLVSSTALSSFSSGIQYTDV
jgi:hypothetical protein